MRQKSLLSIDQLLTLMLRQVRSAAALLTLLSVMSSCATVEQHRIKTLTTEDQIRLQALLEAGQDALQAGRLSAPSQDFPATATGAAELFYQALAIQPDNPDAHRGLEQILEQYVAQAIEAADVGDLLSSYSLLARATSIDPQHPSIRPAQAYVNVLDRADVRSIVVASLSPTALGRIIDSLVIEVKPRAEKCHYRIFAPSDSQARTLYNRLRESYARNDLNIRVRASTTISQPERLERICTP